jgi:hypothetical protein
MVRMRTASTLRRPAAARRPERPTAGRWVESAVGRPAAPASGAPPRPARPPRCPCAPPSARLVRSSSSVASAGLSRVSSKVGRMRQQQQRAGRRAAPAAPHQLWRGCGADKGGAEQVRRRAGQVEDHHLVVEELAVALRQPGHGSLARAGMAAEAPGRGLASGRRPRAATDCTACGAASACRRRPTRSPSAAGAASRLTGRVTRLFLGQVDPSGVQVGLKAGQLRRGVRCGAARWRPGPAQGAHDSPANRRRVLQREFAVERRQRGQPGIASGKCIVKADAAHGQAKGGGRIRSGAWGSGEWGVGSGEWGVGSGEWRMENGEWRTDHRSPFTVHRSRITLHPGRRPAGWPAADRRRLAAGESGGAGCRADNGRAPRRRPPPVPCCGWAHAAPRR